MADMFGRRPPFGSTDWAAQQFLRLLDQEEQRKAEMRRLQQAAWQPVDSGQSTPADDSSVFDEVADRLQNGLNGRQGRQPVAARRTPAPQGLLATALQVAPYRPGHTDAIEGAGASEEGATRLTPANRIAMIRQMIKEFEGGYSNNPNDPGGPTNFGVTQEAIDNYNRDTSSSFPGPRHITRGQAESIYGHILSSTNIDQIADPAIREQMFDMAVNLGPGAAGSMLLDALEQHGYHVKAGSNDTSIGPLALGAISDLQTAEDWPELESINNALVRKRQAHYDDQIALHPTLRQFGGGWRRRAQSFFIRPTGPQR